MSIRRRSAELLQTLIYVDEPQLLLLKSNKTMVLAIAIEKEGLVDPFFGVTVSNKDWEGYLRGGCDLRYLFEFPKTRRLFTFDIADIKNKKVKMVPYNESPISEEHMPSHGLFSSDHTEEYDAYSRSEFYHKFLVDGQWDLPEFGRFYTKFGECYSFMIAMNKLRSVDVLHDVKRKIIDTIGLYPWKGGGSYLHFYKGLVKLLQFDERLDVKEVRYASPGHVEVRGDESAFKETIMIFEAYNENYTEIQKDYDELYDFLRKNKYLKTDAKDFPNVGASKDYMDLKISSINQSLSFPYNNEIAKFSEKNSLVRAKVILSFVRRIDDAFRFHAEGRVRIN